MCGTLQVISVIISAVAGNGASGFNFRSVISFSKILNFQYHLWNLKLSTAFSLKVVLDTTAQIQIKKVWFMMRWSDLGQMLTQPHSFPSSTRQWGKKIRRTSSWVKTKTERSFTDNHQCKTGSAGGTWINLLPGKIELDSEKQRQN